MKKSYLVLIYTLISIGLLSAQVPVLVTDYNLGPDGSIEGRINEYQNSLTYIGNLEDGTKAILQYDQDTDAIEVLSTADDFDYELSRLFSFNDEVHIITSSQDGVQQIIRSEDRDLSNLEVRYEPGTEFLYNYRFYEDFLVITEGAIDFSGLTSIKIIDADNTVKNIISDLPDLGYQYSVTVVKGYVLIGAEEQAINGEYLLAYDIDAGQLVDIESVIPGFTTCGPLSRLSTINDNLIYYQCPDGNFLFDTDSNQYIEYGGEKVFVFYDLEDFVFFGLGDKVYRHSKITNEQTIILENVKRFRNDGTHLIAAVINEDLLDIAYFKFSNQELVIHPTSIVNPDNSVSFTGFADNSQGTHFVLYQNSTDNGILGSVSKTEFSLIDSVYNVDFDNRPVSYKDIIYYTHQDSAVGSELFKIEYSIISTNDKEFIDHVLAPNPAYDIINIIQGDIPLVNSNIVDIQGNTLISDITGNRIKIDQLSAGIYTIVSTYADGRIAKARFTKI